MFRYKPSVILLHRRALSSFACQTSKYQRRSYTLMYGETGDPVQVLQGREVPIPDLEDDQVLVRMVAAPINPADINLLQGTYGTKVALPAVPGNEGVGIVEAIGSNVKDYQLADHVLPAKLQLGTWRTHLVANSEHLTKIDRRIPLVAAATMTLNPCSAWRMLSDFGAIGGDTVIQNGANSAVGQAVIQIAKKMGIRTVNVVRDRANLKELADYLSSLGADYVVSDSELRKPETKELWNKIPRPKLAVDCVSGKNATELLRHLAPGGVLVNYGGMSKQPITVPVSVLIFKEVTVRGFWLSQWRERKPVSEVREMVDSIGEMIINKELKDPLHELVEISDFNQALERAMKPFTSRKQILVMDNRLLNQS